MSDDAVANGDAYDVHDAQAITTETLCGSVDGHASRCRAAAEDIRSTLGDAEDAAAVILDEIVDDIFDKMRVAEENAESIHAAVSVAWRDLLNGVAMAGKTADALMEDDGHDDKSWRRLLRPRIPHDEEEHQRRQQYQPHRRLLTASGSPVVAFLAGLWALFDQRPAWIEHQLLAFPTSRFKLSAVPTHGREGEWEIPVGDLYAFLRRVVLAARLSVLSASVLVCVARTNATLLATKRRANAWLQQPQIALCVHTALLQAEEEEEEDQAKAWQTELEDKPRPVHQEDEELVVYYDEGDDTVAPAVDRNAAGKVPKKTERHATITRSHQLKRSIISILQRRAASDTKWGMLRKRVLVMGDRHFGIAVETDMALAPSPTIDSRKASTSTNTTNTFTRTLPKKKASVVGSSGVGVASLTATKPLTKAASIAIEPDAATLSNIFWLGTPRQLSVDDLARRSDILSLLEREADHHHRKMAVASIIGVGVPSSCVGADGKPIRSDHDTAFQAYAAAHSSVTVARGSCAMPTSLDANVDAKAPTKPHGSIAKTRFDLALEPPQVDVVDGNAHVWIHRGASPPPGKTSKSRAGLTSPTTTSTQPAVGPGLGAVHTVHTVHPRPLETAIGHLPQLDTSRLAVGVKAVQRSVEKRGPRHHPGRNSRRRRHNDTVAQDASETDTMATVSVSSPTAKPPATSETRAAHLPPVSPVKASPHRKHVTFPASPVDTRPPSLSQPLSPVKPHLPMSPVRPHGSRRFLAKQPTHEKQASPPRVRNRHRTEKADAMAATTKRLLQWNDPDPGDGSDANDDAPPTLCAPRRNLVPATTTRGDDNNR